MLKFIIKISILIVPLVLYSLLFLLFEPSNYFGIQPSIWYKATPLYRIMEFERTYENPEKDIYLFGDSRIANFDDPRVEHLPKDNEILNVAFGGSSMKETTDLFYWTMEHNQPEKVVFSVSFYNLNKNYMPDRIDNTMAYSDDLPLYLRSLEYHKKMWIDFVDRILSVAVSIRDFIRGGHVINADFDNYAQEIYNICYDYELSTDMIDELKNVSRFCEDNDIEFYIIHPPLHPSIWQQVIEPLELQDEIEFYKTEMLKIAPVLDLENTAKDNLFANEYSEYYIDGFHILRTTDAFLQYKNTVYDFIESTPSSSSAR